MYDSSFPSCKRGGAFIRARLCGTLAYSCRLTSMSDGTILFGGLWFGTGSGFGLILINVEGTRTT